MANEVLVYKPIFDDLAISIVQQLDALRGQDITVRINTPGGSPEASWGVIAKLQEHTGGLKIKVDGQAASAGAFMLCYATTAECLDVSTFLFHRAAYWFEAYENLKERYMTEAAQTSLNNINNSLRRALESKVDAAQWKQVTGVTIAQLFDNNQRIDVPLTAQQAKQLGLVSQITKITMPRKKEIVALANLQPGYELFHAVAAYTENEPAPGQQPTKTVTKMTMQEIKAAHPEAYAAIVAEATAAERDRVTAWAEFYEVDPVAVAAGIASGKPISQTENVKFCKAIAMKAATNGQPTAEAQAEAQKLAAEGAKPLTTAEEPAKAGGAKPEVKAFEEGVFKLINAQKQA